MSYPLHTNLCDYGIVRDLVIAGADINLRDEADMTALDLALCFRHTDQTCILLYALGAEYNKHCWSTTMACKEDTATILMIRYNLFPTFRNRLVNYKGMLTRLLEGNFPTLSEICAFELQCAKIRQEIEEERKLLLLKKE